MALVKVINTTASTLHVPEPVGRVFKAHEHVTLRAAAADFDNPAINDLLRRGLIKVEVTADPNTPSDVQVLPAKAGNRELFNPSATVSLYVSYSDGVVGGDGSPSRKFNSIQAAFDSIPDGFRARVLVYVAPGESPSSETSLTLTAKPGIAESIYSNSWAGTVRVIGEDEVLGEIVPTSSGAWWTSDNGVQRLLYSTPTHPWDLDIVEGEHYITQAYHYVYQGQRTGTILIANAFPRDDSNKVTGELISTAGLIGANNALAYLEPAKINTWATRIGCYYIRSSGGAPLAFYRIRFTGLSSAYDAEFSQCKFDSNPQIISGVNYVFVTGCFFQNRVMCYGSRYMSLTLNEYRHQANAYYGAFWNFGGYFKGPNARLVIGNNDHGHATSTGPCSVRYGGVIDAEGCTEAIRLIGGSTFTQRNGDIVVDGVQTPIKIQDGGHYKGSSGSFTGKCTKPALVRWGGSAMGTNRWSFTNTTNVGQDLKVGDNAPISWDDINAKNPKKESDPTEAAWVYHITAD